MEQAGIDPALVPAIFDIVGTVRFVELWRGHGLEACGSRRGRILTCEDRALKAREGERLSRLWSMEQLCYTTRGLGDVQEGRPRTGNPRGEIMARGREKDRKVRKKHRKNVERVKRLARTRRAAAKKAKRA